MRLNVFDKIIEGEEILVPTFELSSNPTVRISDIKARKFYLSPAHPAKPGYAEYLDEVRKYCRKMKDEYFNGLPMSLEPQIEDYWNKVEQDLMAGIA